MADIRTWIREEGIDIRQDASIGAAVLKHVLASEEPDRAMENIATYVCDPTFHSPGSGFILDLVRELLPRSWNLTSWDLLGKSICSATELGLISADDLKNVIREILGNKRLRVSFQVGPGSTANGVPQLHLVYSILESLGRCAVLQVTDLGSQMLQNLFSEFAKRPYLRWCKAMVWRLLPWAEETHVPFIARFALHPLEVQRRQVAADEILGQALAGRLMRLKPKLLPLVLTYTTEKLLVHSRVTSMADYRFVWHHWFNTLAILGSSSYKVCLTAKTWDILQHAESTLSPDQRLFAFAWNALALGHEWRTSTNLSDRLNFLDCFEALVNSLPTLTMDTSRGIVVGLSELLLPYQEVLVQNMTRLARYDVKLPNVSEVEPAVKRITSTSTLDERIQHAHFGHSAALAAVLHNAKYGPMAFKALARRMIHKNTMSFGIVCHFLEHDKKLKMSLTPGSGWQLRRPNSKSTSVIRSVFVNTKDRAFGVTTACSSGYGTINLELNFKAKVIDLIHDLAISFATSPVATPRSAFRRVYWCYLFLRHHRLPIEPIVTRALWHTSVTRYGDQGAAAAQLKWALSLVRLVEGEGVAKQLLWSEIFRRSRAEQVDALAEPTKEEEANVLAMLREEGSVSDGVFGTDRGLCPSNSVTFADTGIDSLLTGDEEVDLETRKKIAFLQSEPPHRPFWLPENGTKQVEESRGDRGIFSHVLIKPPGFFGGSARNPEFHEGYLDSESLSAHSFVWEADETLPSSKVRRDGETGTPATDRPYEWWRGGRRHQSRSERRPSMVRKNSTEVVRDRR